MAIGFTEQFAKNNAWDGGVRQRHARAAWEDPDARLRLDAEGGAGLELATKLVDVPSRRHVLLVIATYNPQVPLAISSAYRLYGADSELERLRHDPRAALMELIRRYGRDFSLAGGPDERFVESRRVDTFDIQARGDAGSFTTQAFFKRLETGDFDVRYVWVIDDGKYRAARRSN